MDWILLDYVCGISNMGFLSRTPMPVNVASNAKVNQMNTALRVQPYRPKGGVVK